MSTSVLKTLPVKLDIKRHSPSIPIECIHHISYHIRCGGWSGEGSCGHGFGHKQKVKTEVRCCMDMVNVCGKCSKFLNTFLFLFPNKIVIFRKCWPE